MLLTTGHIEPGGLDVSVRPRRDPDPLPGGRYDERTDPVDDVCIRDPGTVGIAILPAAAPAPPGQSGTVGVGSPQPHHVQVALSSSMTTRVPLPRAAQSSERPGRNQCGGSPYAMYVRNLTGRL